MTTIAKYIYTVNSAQRSSGTITDFNLVLSQTIQKQAKDSIFNCRVINASIPFSFYGMSEDINSIAVDFFDGTTTKTSTITLTPANYTTNSVNAAFVAALTAECQISAGAYVGFDPQLTFSYSTSTGRTTMSMAAVGKSITIHFSANLPFGGFFGFSTDVVLTSAATQTSTKICVANPISNLYVRSGNLTQYRNREFVVERDAYSDILYYIPIQTNSNTWIQWTDDQESVFILNDYISEINIYLTTNLNYNPINLHGLDWGLTFYIEEIIPPTFTHIARTNLTMPVPEVPPELMALRESALQEAIKYKDKLAKKLPDEKILSKIKDALLFQSERKKDRNRQRPTAEPEQRRADPGPPVNPPPRQV